MAGSCDVLHRVEGKEMEGVARFARAEGTSGFAVLTDQFNQKKRVTARQFTKSGACLLREINDKV